MRFFCAFPSQATQGAYKDACIPLSIVSAAAPGWVFYHHPGIHQRWRCELQIAPCKADRLIWVERLMQLLDEAYAQEDNQTPAIRAVPK